MKILITCSGTGSRMGEYTKYTNKALIKIGDKFSIDYIIDNFKNIINKEFIITLGYYGDFVKQYLEVAYPNLKFTFIEIDNFEGLGSSQGYSLLKTKNYIQEPFVFVACDTIILDNEYVSNYKIEKNKIYVYKHDDSLNYSTITLKNKAVKSVNDKGEKKFDFIYIGKTEIFNYKDFWDNLESCYNQNQNNSCLSDINAYTLMLSQQIPFDYKEVKKWYDSGNPNIFKKDICLKTRYNVLFKLEESISFHDNQIVKFFYDKNKNIKRLNRIEYLKDITPKIYKTSDNFHSMELIDSKPLSQMKDIKIIDKLLNWSFENLWIKYEKIQNFENVCYKFYYEKTIDRIKKVMKQNITDFDIINGIQVGSIDNVISKVNFNELINCDNYRFHGDFILENILIKDNKFVLIDWREDFGNDIKNGDIYYDLAKLKHNIYFNHENIDNNLFSLTYKNDNECILDLKCNYELIYQVKEYEDIIKQKELSNKKINILMSLIWINMSPLHEPPLNNFLLNFGKFNLFLSLK